MNPIIHRPEDEPPDFDRVVPQERGPQPWRCYRSPCAGGGWWLSTRGVVSCLSCTPPAMPGLVVEQGTVVTAPLVELHRSTTPAGTSYGREPPPAVEAGVRKAPHRQPSSETRPLIT